MSEKSLFMLCHNYQSAVCSLLPVVGVFVEFGCTLTSGRHEGQGGGELRRWWPGRHRDPHSAKKGKVPSKSLFIEGRMIKVIQTASVTSLQCA